MTPWDLVIFDWDGTLADSIHGIVCSMQAAADELGVARPGEEAVREIIGLGLHEAITTIFPGLPESEWGRLRDAYARAYLELAEEIVLFDGALELLEALQTAGVPVSVATGKSRRGLDRALRVTGTAHYFCATRCADEGPGKPDPAMTHYLVERAGARSSRVVLVGDTAHDLEMARRAGVQAIGVSWGAHDAHRLLAYNPVLVADRVADLHAPLLETG